MRRAALALCAALAACAPAAAPVAVARGAVAAEALPPMRRFDGPPARVPVPGNAQLARDVLALSFALETGRPLATFTRFEGPVTIAVEAVGGPVPPTLGPDLSDLLARLEREAGIATRRAAPGEMASITVSALPRATLEREARGAACFVIPGVAGWTDWRARRGSPATDWTRLAARTRATVFLPSDVAPQEIRDCLHEEVAQALGPLNDLYRLPSSVFDDANMHVALTAWDMLVLRATYDPALRSGLSRAQVAAALPAILARLNPRGEGRDAGPVAEADAGWTRDVSAALAPDTAGRARIARAAGAVARARAAGWEDTRTALSLLAYGRAVAPVDREAALAALLEAGDRYRAISGEGVQTARVALHVAAISLSRGQASAALAQVDRALPAARGAQDAALVATLLLLRAQALAETGRDAEAVRARAEGLAFGRYGFGDRDLHLRAAEVAGLAPAA